MSTEPDDRAASRTSKRLSWALRHGANELGLAMDTAGWVDEGALLRLLALDEGALERAVDENDKARFERRDGRIRACQGHSRAGTPVTAEGLEASWVRHEGEGLVWHGTGLAALEGIDREGIHSAERTHVHLACALDSVVGKRAGVDVMLAVAPTKLRAAGIELWQSDNGVVLVRSVPRAAVVGLRPMTKRARAQCGPWLARYGSA